MYNIFCYLLHVAIRIRHCGCKPSRDKIPQVLQHIEEQHLLQPLMVVKLLAVNKCATLSDIKPYIVRHLEEQNEAINNLIDRNRRCVYNHFSNYWLMPM